MILGILQARMNSRRFPGKVLKPILGVPMILRQIERLKQSKKMDHLLVATSREVSDDPIAEVCRYNRIECFRGHLEDVLDRFYQAAALHQPEHVIRFTGDCPLADAYVIDNLVNFYLDGNFDYASNALEPTYPDGLDAEIFRFSSLAQAWKEAVASFDREHVTPYFYCHPERFKIGSLKGARDLSSMRWTVDEEDDFKFVTCIFDGLYHHKPTFEMADILEHLKHHPELQAINASHTRNEGAHPC